MADSKITDLTNYTTPQATDVFPIVDVSTSTTKKIQYQNLGLVPKSGTLSPAAVLFTDASGNAKTDLGDLSWDDTNKIMTINYASNTVAAGTNVNLGIAGDFDVYQFIGNGVNGYPSHTCSSSRGNQVTPLINQTGDILGIFSHFSLMGGVTPTYIEMTRIQGATVGTHPTALGGQLDFYTRQDNGTLTKAATIDNTQKMTLTTPGTATGSVVTVDGTQTLANKTITAPVISTISNTGTVTLPTATDTLVARATTDTLNNKRINPRLVTAASYTTDTGTALDVSTCDQFEITAQAGALKLNNPGGTPTGGAKLIIRIKDNGTARALTYDTYFRAMGNALPSTTVLSKTLYMGFIFNATDTKWDLVAVAQEA